MGVSLRARLGLWTPPLVLMAVIFALSAQPDLSTGLGVLDLIGRKFVHAGEYALLCLLWWRALRTVIPPGRALGGALGIAVVYAMSDDFHQTFVPGRNGSPVDVLIDAAGASLAAALVWRRTAPRRAAAGGRELEVEAALHPRLAGRVDDGPVHELAGRDDR